MGFCCASCPYGFGFRYGLFKRFHKARSQILRNAYRVSEKAGEVVILVIGELIVYATVIPVKAQIMNFLSVYISLMELISILENLALLGVPVPGFIVRALHQTQEIMDNGKEE